MDWPLKIFLTLLTAWSLFWKGWAVWYCVRNKDIYWFVGMLVLNSFGILELFYLIFWAKDKPSFIPSLRP